MGFLLAANACALLVLKRWRPLLEYVVGMLLAGLFFVPMLPFIRYQMSAHTSPIQNRETWFEGFKFVTWRMKGYLLPPGWDASLVVRSWLLRFCYVAALFLIYRNRRRLKPEAIALWTITMVIALFFLLIDFSLNFLQVAAFVFDFFRAFRRERQTQKQKNGERRRRLYHNQ